MRRRVLAAIGLCAAFGSAAFAQRLPTVVTPLTTATRIIPRATPATAALPPGDAALTGLADCQGEAALAEAREGVPSGLLLAIGKVESGRRDPLSGQRLPWPWAVNAEGEGRLFASPGEAIGFAAQRQAQGQRRIDVGCFQIDLLYHPEAFASLAEAFDPGANARYAARFLARLHAEAGSWEEAVKRYHSAVPGMADGYRDAVYAAWQGKPAGAPGAAPMLAPPIYGMRVQHPGNAIASAGGLPHVIVP